MDSNSAALILFSATAVAQEVKEEKANGTVSTMSVTGESYGVTVGDSDATMAPGEIRLFPIIILTGYSNPFLIYGEVCDTEIEGDIFHAQILMIKGNYYIQVTAGDVSKPTGDVIYVKALQEYIGYGLNADELPGAPLVIIVDPTLN